MPSVAGDQMPGKVSGKALTWALGAVNSGQAAPFRSAAEGWEGSPLGSIPGVHGTLQLCFSNAIQMKAERGNPISLGIALKCRAAFPLNSVFWLPCCRLTHGVFLLINLFIVCLIIISNSKTWQVSFVNPVSTGFGAEIWFRKNIWVC